MMQLEDFDQLNDVYRHVYLSPHLDDAPLSCGGAIAAHVAAGERVLVVTICTAAPPPAGPFSALAQELHANWGLAADQAVAARLREERLAMERLGVDYYWADRLDAIYRYAEAYHTRESLFSAPAHDDPLFADLRGFFGKLHEHMPNATYYAPLGIGSHVDHLITHSAIRDILGDAARFYEDLPYAVVPGATDQRLAQLTGIVSATTIQIDDTLAQKLQSIHAYASQLKELFGEPKRMEQVMTDYAASILPHGGRYGERIWRIDSA
jgi:LmbE family N-acetylglucosaminyl deacetylase